MRFFLVFLVLVSCGDQNIFIDKNDKDRADVLLDQAVLYYDEGSLKLAEETAEKAKILDPEETQIRYLLANVYLAKGGFDFFSLILNIIKKQDKDALSEVKDVSDLLKNFKDVFYLSEADITKMGTLSASTNSFFAGLDVYHPAIPGDVTSSDSPRSQVLALKSLNQTISILCPYIVSTDIRALYGTNSRYQCEATPDASHQAESYFLFGISHLIEAIMFHRILLYEAENAETIENVTGNLARRANKLNTITMTQDNMPDYVAAVGLLKTDIDRILDTTNTASMLNETVRNFKIAANAFGEIPGLPSSVTGSIKDQLKAMDEAIAKVGSGTQNAQGSVFKDQLNKELLPKLTESIAKFKAKFPEETDKLKTVCDTFKQIAPEGTTLPTDCI
jgi:hypothetical protein